jgi:2-hydroxychromene-2-carboxylate isomerase
VAQRRGAGIAFAQAISSRIWGGIEHWNEDEHLEAAAAEAGLSLAEMRADIEADVSGIDAEIDANQTALEDAGHWGVPTFVFEGEPFFGQDRIDLLVWRMQQKGLTKRA